MRACGVISLALLLGSTGLGAEDLFDGTGRAAAFIDGEQRLVDYTGRVAGFITAARSGPAVVHDAAGRHLGWYQDGAVHDRAGQVLWAATDRRVSGTQFPPALPAVAEASLAAVPPAHRWDAPGAAPVLSADFVPPAGGSPGLAPAPLTPLPAATPRAGPPVYDAGLRALGELARRAGSNPHLSPPSLLATRALPELGLAVGDVVSAITAGRELAELAPEDTVEQRIAQRGSACRVRLTHLRSIATLYASLRDGSLRRLSEAELAAHQHRLEQEERLHTELTAARHLLVTRAWDYAGPSAGERLAVGPMTERGLVLHPLTAGDAPPAAASATGPAAATTATPIAPLRLARLAALIDSGQLIVVRE